MFGLGGDERYILWANHGKRHVPDGGKVALPASEGGVASERARVLPITETDEEVSCCVICKEFRGKSLPVRIFLRVATDHGNECEHEEG